MKLVSFSHLIGVIALGVFSLLLTSCTTDPEFEELGVTVNAYELPPLDASEGHYELWFSYPDDPVSGKRNAIQHGDASFVSLGKFVVGEDGTMTGLDGDAPSFVIPTGYNPNLLIDAVLTVESSRNSEAPTSRFLAGVFTGTEARGTAVLTMKGFDAFGAGFDTANLSGTYQLMTQSTAATDDEAQGIWFINLIGQPSLKLRRHPINTENEGWTYESWLTRDQGGTIEYISLGEFDNPDSLDNNGAGPNGGPDPILIETPGEDFVQGTIRLLNDGTYGILIALQPKELDLDHPFQVLLEDQTIPDTFVPADTRPLNIAQGVPAIEIIVDR